MIYFYGSNILGSPSKPPIGNQPMGNEYRGTAWIITWECSDLPGDKSSYMVFIPKQSATGSKSFVGGNLGTGILSDTKTRKFLVTFVFSSG